MARTLGMLRTSVTVGLVTEWLHFQRSTGSTYAFLHLRPDPLIRFQPVRAVGLGTLPLQNGYALRHTSFRFTTVSSGEVFFKWPSSLTEKKGRKIKTCCYVDIHTDSLWKPYACSVCMNVRFTQLKNWAIKARRLKMLTTESHISYYLLSDVLYHYKSGYLAVYKCLKEPG